MVLLSFEITIVIFSWDIVVPTNLLISNLMMIRIFLDYCGEFNNDKITLRIAIIYYIIVLFEVIISVFFVIFSRILRCFNNECLNLDSPI